MTRITFYTTRARTLRLLCLLLFVLCLVSCGGGTRQAILHAEGDPGYIPCSAQPLELEIHSPQAFVYDCNRGEILYQKGEDRVVYPASTTKLLTILTALEYLSEDEIITPGDELSLVDAASSIAYITTAHQLRVDMLIEGMLLPSGNDAAYVLAAAAGNRISGGTAQGAKAIEIFMTRMQQYATELGLVGTTFTAPDGLASEEHYTTVEDMILIARRAIQSDCIMRYAGLAEDDVTYASGHINHWANTNLLLQPESIYYRSCVKGLKTGSLTGNYCVIALMEQGEQSYLIGVFGAQNKTVRYDDATRIIDYLLALHQQEGAAS